MIWNFGQVDVTKIKKCLNDIDWNMESLGLSVNQKVNFPARSILNIFSNYCAN